MPPEALSSPGGSRTVAEASCRRCGSLDVRRLSLIHQIGLASAEEPAPGAASTLRRFAAPPRQKHAMMWTLLAAASVGFAAAAYASARTGFGILAAVAALTTTFAARAAYHNRRVYPNLRKLWERSFMCSRCGEIFAATPDH